MVGIICWIEKHQALFNIHFTSRPGNCSYLPLACREEPLDHRKKYVDWYNRSASGSMESLLGDDNDEELYSILNLRPILLSGKIEAGAHHPAFSVLDEERGEEQYYV